MFFKKKSVSLGIKYELEKLFGLVETIDEKEAKLKALRREKKMVMKMLNDLNRIDSKVLKDEKRVRAKIGKIRKEISLSSSHVKKLDKLSAVINSLKEDIIKRGKEYDSKLLSLSDYVKMFGEVRGKIAEEEKKIRKSIKELDKKIEKEKSRKAIGYSAKVVDEKLDIPKIKAEIPKKKEVVDEALDDEKVEVIKEEPKSNVETEIDKLLKLVREKKKVSFSRLAKIYNEKESTIEEWVEALEEGGFVEVVYPLIGSPYIKLKEAKR